MINRNLEKVIKKAEKSVKLDEKERYLIRKNIETEIKYIQQLIKENPGITKDVLSENVIIQMSDEQMEYIESALMAGSYYQLEAILTLLKDKELFKKLFYFFMDKKEEMKIKSKEPPPILYNANHKESCKKILEEVFIMFWKYNEMYKDIKKENKIKNKRKNKITPGEKIIESIVLCDDEPTIGCITDILLSMKEIIEGDIKESHIKAMEFIGEKFKRYNLLDRYKKENDRNFGKHNLDGYTYELSTGKYNKDEIGIEEIFTRKFLETLDLDEIGILSTHWQNRYAKECQNLGEALFAIDTLNLWEKIMKGEEIEISDKKIDLIYSKNKCLKEVSSMLLKNIADNNKKAKREDREKGYKSVSGQREIDTIIKQESKNYKKIFDEKLKNIPNNLKEDLNLYALIINYTENIYYIRSNNLGSMIRILINNKKSMNWGLIEDENDKVDSEKYVLIGIDFEGFNMPIRLHLKKRLLIEVLKTYNGNMKVPIYEGASDFIKEDTLLPTNILMPLQKKQKKLINAKVQEEGNSNHLINHLAFLKDSNKYPEHLKIHEFGTQRKIRPPRKYKDIESNKYYIKSKNEYIPFDNDGDKNNETR